MKRAIIAIILGFAILVSAFGIYAVYGCFDYVNRCVSITPRDNIKAVEMNKLYSIEDFFLIEREKDTSNRWGVCGIFTSLAGTVHSSGNERQTYRR